MTKKKTAKKEPSKYAPNKFTPEERAEILAPYVETRQGSYGGRIPNGWLRDYLAGIPARYGGRQLTPQMLLRMYSDMMKAQEAKEE